VTINQPLLIQLLDFPRLSEWHTTFIISLALPPGKSSSYDLVKGDTIDAKFFGNVNAPCKIMENNPKELKWRGDVFYVLSGEHSFRFEPSKINPGGTTFIHAEVYFRLNIILMTIESWTVSSIHKMFEGFNQELKGRVESLKSAAKQ